MVRIAPLLKLHVLPEADAPTSAPSTRTHNEAFLSERERGILRAIASAALPAGARFASAGVWTTAKLEDFLATLPRVVRVAVRATLWAIEASALISHRRSFAALSLEKRSSVLQAWHDGSTPRRLALRALLTPLKIAHFNDPAVYAKLGCVFRSEPLEPEPQKRTMRRGITAGATLNRDLTIDTDVVVIGTGAGGAVVAKELAERGLAVVLLEEGEPVSRTDFTGHSVALQKRLFRDMGATFAIGNAPLLLPMGRAVGGTTVVNAGTCFRTPERVLATWRSGDGAGLDEMTPEHMAPYFARVERVLQVGVAQEQHLGGIARVIARGCDVLGYHHAALKRNAPDCDGKGACFFGCPTDAKRSTNVSYVPMALRAGAQLYTGTRVERVLAKDGHAIGVQASTAGGAQLTVRARTVVVACGSLLTPVLLERSGLCGSSGQLGRNLSVHPAGGVGALFDEPIRGWEGIPQGYSIDHFEAEGLLFEGAFMPPDLGAGALPFFGRQLVDVVEQYERFACFGYMIEDASRGRIRPGPGGRPIITYVVKDEDVRQLRRAVGILARVYFAAGARKVFPFVSGFDALHSLAEVEQFERAPLRARDFDLSGYHPLGTARAGSDPKRSVVDADFQAHDVRGLFITDGSAVPSSIGVNPQVTIMALATRAADRIGDQLG